MSLHVLFIYSPLFMFILVPVLHHDATHVPVVVILALHVIVVYVVSVAVAYMEGNHLMVRLTFITVLRSLKL